MDAEEVLKRLRDITSERIEQEKCSLECAEDWYKSARETYESDMRFFGKDSCDSGEMEYALVELGIAKTRLSLLNGVLHDIEVIQQEIEQGDDAIPAEGEYDG